MAAVYICYHVIDITQNSPSCGARVGTYMENAHVVNIIRYIYKLVIIIILNYTTLHVQYFKVDIGNYNQNKRGPYSIFSKLYNNNYYKNANINI